MRWEYPWLLALLVAIPLLFIGGRRPTARPAAVLWVRTRRWGAQWGAWLLRANSLLPWIALLLAVLAMARPQQGIRRSEIETRGVDIVLALDISTSMAAEDFRPLNRLYVARETARDFIRQRPHDRIGLVAFSGTAFKQCPLTLDHEALTELLLGLNFGLSEPGTAIGMGLAAAVSGLKNSRTPSKVVVLLTDGESNAGAIDPLTGADLARAFGIKVYTVLVGRAGVVPVSTTDSQGRRHVEMVPMNVDEGVLREIAKNSGGRFFRAQDPEALSQIYSEIDRLERAPIRSVVYREYQDLGPQFLAIAAAVFGVYLLFSSTLAFRLP
jgi:Ca-activated chloride channel family protein